MSRCRTLDCVTRCSGANLKAPPPGGQGWHQPHRIYGVWGHGCEMASEIGLDRFGFGAWVPPPPPPGDGVSYFEGVY